MCFVWIWEQTAIISLYNINWLVFITETECVYCAVRTGYLNIIRISLVVKGWCAAVKVYLLIFLGVGGGGFVTGQMTAGYVTNGTREIRKWHHTKPRNGAVLWCYLWQLPQYWIYALWRFNYIEYWTDILCLPAEAFKRNPALSFVPNSNRINILFWGVGGRRSAESFKTTRSPLPLRYFARVSTRVARRTKQTNKQTWLQIQHSAVHTRGMATELHSPFSRHTAFCPRSPVQFHQINGTGSLWITDGRFVAFTGTAQCCTQTVRITFTGPARLLTWLYHTHCPQHIRRSCQIVDMTVPIVPTHSLTVNLHINIFHICGN